VYATVLLGCTNYGSICSTWSWGTYTYNLHEPHLRCLKNPIRLPPSSYSAQSASPALSPWSLYISAWFYRCY
jgi:hypothetical protein